MSINCLNFRPRIKALADAAKSLTVIAVISYTFGLPLGAQAQSFNIGPVNINLGGTGGGSGLLPPTNLDSFVYQAGTNAEMIYGDEPLPTGGEGTSGGGQQEGGGQFAGLPPQFGFTTDCRINAGITGQNAAGLTTGHGGLMPSAWGADEFLSAPGEWCNTANGGNQIIDSAAALDAADLLENSIGTGTDLWNLFGSSISGLLSGSGIGGITGTISTPIGSITGSFP